MAREYKPKGFKSIFVYTREAHPGEHYPAHRSIEQKISQAMAFKQILGIERPILVDDVIGTGHEMYGTLPNMTYIVARASGRVLFRADWTDPPTIKNAMDYILDSRERRRDGVRLTAFYSEVVGYRWSDQAKQEEALARAGQQAVEDMASAMQKRGTGPRPGFISLDS